MKVTIYERNGDFILETRVKPYKVVNELELRHFLLIDLQLDFDSVTSVMTAIETFGNYHFDTETTYKKVA